MANIVLKTFAAGDDGQGTVTPQDDALIYQNAIPMNGIFSGAAVTLSEANVLHVAAGFGIIGGRFFEINESDVTVELSSSGTLLGRLYIHLELTNADVPISINVATGASLPALVGDPDLNINDGAFDLELATFNVSEVTISDLVNTFPTISKANNQLRRATAYSVNDMVLCQSASDSLIFICTTAGTTAIQEPTAYATVTDGNTVTDGTAVFKAVGLTAEIDRTRAMIAPVLSTLVAPAGGLAIGDQFVYNGLLYKATAAIAQGGTITINGNCALADSVTKQLIEQQGKISILQGLPSTKLGLLTKSLNEDGGQSATFNYSVPYNDVRVPVLAILSSQIQAQPPHVLSLFNGGGFSTGLNDHIGTDNVFKVSANESLAWGNVTLLYDNSLITIW